MATLEYFFIKTNKRNIKIDGGEYKLIENYYISEKLYNSVELANTKLTLYSSPEHLGKKYYIYFEREQKPSFIKKTTLMCD